MNEAIPGVTGGKPFFRPALLALTAAGTLALCSGTAWAKACIDTRNDGAAFGKWEPDAKTTVKNATASTSILVEIYRGGDEKQHKYLAPKEETNFTAKLGGQSAKGTIRVQLYPEGSSRSTECKYIVEEASSGSYLSWSLPEGATAVCPDPGDVSIDCQLDFHKEKYRWHTALTVRDLR